jgi:short/branched chain acyl-CoA dehydrogenase
MASLFSISEEEEMLRDAVRKFANEVVAPKVMEMDEAEHMDPTIVKGLFDQGVSLHCASRRDGSGH